ncbi:MAG: parvulin peptidyl-prolyl isomerase [Chlorobi bacterium]|nr:parvulin peptidyl-prolyl isomerase [Chlorobiota bacterium]
MKKYIFLLLTITFINITAQEVVDKIVAVVDKEIILKSELDFQTAYVAAQQNLNPNDPALKKKILDKMIEDKLLVAQAEIDSIEVTDDEVSMQLENQIKYFIQQYGSQERFEKAYGMPLEKIKRKLRDDTRKNLMAQRMKQKKFGTVEVTRSEVKEFFETFKDSLGQISEKFDISHIFINPKLSGKMKEKAREFAASLIDSIKNGADFAELAKKYSDDPGSAVQGGDLGWVKRGVFYPEFEAAAYQLANGQLSGVIESPVGFHVIQMIERRGESIHVRHILIMVKQDDEADLKAIEKLNEIRDSIIAGAHSFEFYAKKYSDDKESAKYGGRLGVFEAGQLDKSMKDQVYKMKEGEISYPKRLDISRGVYGYHIILLNKRIPAHTPNLKEDYDEIKKIAQYHKETKLFDEWITELKKQIFWEIKL